MPGIVPEGYKPNKSNSTLFWAKHRSFQPEHARHNRVIWWPDDAPVDQDLVNTPRKLIGHPVQTIDSQNAVLVLAGSESSTNAILDESSENVVFKPPSNSSLNDPPTDRPLDWPLCIICSRVVLNPFFYQVDALGNEFNLQNLHLSLIENCKAWLPMQGMTPPEELFDENWDWIGPELHRWIGQGPSTDPQQQAQWIGQI